MRAQRFRHWVLDRARIVSSGEATRGHFDSPLMVNTHVPSSTTTYIEGDRTGLRSGVPPVEGVFPSVHGTMSDHIHSPPEYLATVWTPRTPMAFSN